LQDNFVTDDGPASQVRLVSNRGGDIKMPCNPPVVLLRPLGKQQKIGHSTAACPPHTKSVIETFRPPSHRRVPYRRHPFTSCFSRVWLVQPVIASPDLGIRAWSSESRGLGSGTSCTLPSPLPSPL